MFLFLSYSLSLLPQWRAAQAAQRGKRKIQDNFLLEQVTNSKL